MKKFLITLSWLFCTIIFGIPFGLLHKFLIPQKGESIFLISEGASNLFTGLTWSYIFFLTLLFTAFGGAKKYWWIGFALIPAVLFEVVFDLQHLYFPIAIGLVGWLVGRGLAWLVEKK